MFNVVKPKDIPEFWNCQQEYSSIVEKITKRLELLLGSRRKHPWGKSLGFARGLTENIFKGQIPSGETLARIRRVENSRTDWLLSGEGPPFYVTAYQSDVETACLLETLLEDEASWKITLVIDGGRFGVVLSQPGALVIKEQKINYTIVDVIFGVCGSATLGVVRNSMEHEVKFIDVLPKQFDEIRSGNAGTNILFGDEGWLVQASAIKNKAAFDEVMASRSLLLMVNEPATKYAPSEIDENLLDQIIEIFEEEITEQGLNLTSKEKARRIARTYDRAARIQSAEANKDDLKKLLDDD
jgi:hypothetical protein